MRRARLVAAAVPLVLIAGLIGLTLLLGSVTSHGSGQSAALTCLPLTGSGASPGPGSAASPGPTPGAGPSGNAGGAGMISITNPAPLAQAAALDTDQARNAAVIVTVGRTLGVPLQGWLVALATALQESGLRNLPYGDRDSLGLFQQRGPWGSVAERTDPATATTLFFQGGRGGQPGLLSVPGWQQLPLTVAAQAVQQSAFPDAYARWQTTAQRLVAAALGAGIVTVPAGSTDLLGLAGAVACPVADATLGAAVVSTASRWLGTAYSWGGGDLHGPTLGFGPGAGTVGFDCSSLARYAWYVGSGGRVVLPRVTTDQAHTGTFLPASVPLAPGDLMFFQDPSDPPGIYHHVGIYAGDSAMLQAPHTGGVVELVPHVLDVPYFRSQFVGAIRPSLGQGSPRAV